MDSPFFCSEEKNDYQQMLTTLLADRCRRLEVPSAVAVDLLKLPENLGRLYFVSIKAYSSLEFHGTPKVTCWWQNVERFSMRPSERPSGYCMFLDCWG